MTQVKQRSHECPGEGLELNHWLLTFWHPVQPAIWPEVDADPAIPASKRLLCSNAQSIWTPSAYHQDGELAFSGRDRLPPVSTRNTNPDDLPLSAWG